LFRAWVVPGSVVSTSKGSGRRLLKDGVHVAFEDTYNNSKGITVVTTTTKEMFECVKKLVSENLLARDHTAN